MTPTIAGARYRWVSPFHWFEEQFLDENNIHGEVRATISSLVRLLDPDDVQTYFQSEMDKDGYFIAYLQKECPECNLLIEETESISCYFCNRTFHNLHYCINIEDYEWIDSEGQITHACWQCLALGKHRSDGDL